MNAKFSVIIPLYNKEAEVERTLRSVLAQTLPPTEIVVVDDGSTDGSAEVVERVIAEVERSAASRKTATPIMKLIRQANAGETAARNRAMAEAGAGVETETETNHSGRTGNSAAAPDNHYFALVDADDEWHPGFLTEVAALIDEFPGAGLYSTGFDIVNTDGEHPAHTLRTRGMVDNFFRASMRAYVTIPSASVIPRRVVEAVGGFPEGMRLGGDQYMWTKIARRFPVCFSPARLVRYYMAASNRSAAIYKPEATAYSFEDFYTPGADDLNEFIARVALGKAIVISAKGGTADGRRAERFFAYNRLSRRLWWRLWALNRLPVRWRPALHALYTDLAWRLAKKGL
jgi:glycosyltransferase involved in cell wall biosynthesis